MPAQIVDVCDEHQKESKLARLLEEIGDEKIIVFTETKRKCDELTRCDADVIIDMTSFSSFSSFSPSSS